MMEKHFKSRIPWIFVLVVSAAIITLTGCGKSSSSGSSSDNNDTEALAAEGNLFPRGLAVASPFDVEEGTVSASSLAHANVAKAISSDTTSRYDAISEAIGNILDAGSAALCRFDPELLNLFAQTGGNADCYGPTVDYVNHPDGSPANGQLPGGDVGIWMEEDSGGNACAAAQLNARMRGTRDRTKAALMGLATIVCAINTSGSHDFPENGTTDATDIMPETDGVTWNAATLTHATVDSEDKYSYTLDFDYDEDGAVSGDEIHVYLNMSHIPNADSAVVYRGRFSFQISETIDYGGNCPTNEVTRNGWMVYSRTGRNNLVIESKDAQFCGLDADGLDADGIVDETMKHDAVTEPNGWANDFNLLRADFDPLTRLGDYAYAWQAGMMDGNVRAFNLVAEDDGDDATEDFSATAFFGYGEDAENDDPSITGFIGNWAGPGNNHQLYYMENAQKQVVDFNSATRLFDSTSVNIQYAPTNNLNHPANGFAYDSSPSETLDVIGPFDHQLAAGSDTDGDTIATIEETIAEAGVSVPAAPACLNCQP